MRTINISTDETTDKVPLTVTFQAAPGDDFADGEKLLIQLVNHNGEKVGKREIRSVIKTHDGDENHRAWYEAYISTE